MAYERFATTIFKQVGSKGIRSISDTISKSEDEKDARKKLSELLIKTFEDKYGVVPNHVKDNLKLFARDIEKGDGVYDGPHNDIYLKDITDAYKEIVNEDKNKELISYSKNLKSKSLLTEEIIKNIDELYKKEFLDDKLDTTRKIRKEVKLFVQSDPELLKEVIGGTIDMSTARGYNKVKTAFINEKKKRVTELMSNLTVEEIRGLALDTGLEITKSTVKPLIKKDRIYAKKAITPKLLKGLTNKLSVVLPGEQYSDMMGDVNKARSNKEKYNIIKQYSESYAPNLFKKPISMSNKETKNIISRLNTISNNPPNKDYLESLLELKNKFSKEKFDDDLVVRTHDAELIISKIDNILQNKYAVGIKGKKKTLPELRKELNLMGFSPSEIKTKTQVMDLVKKKRIGLTDDKKSKNMMLKDLEKLYGPAFSRAHQDLNETNLRKVWKEHTILIPKKEVNNFAIYSDLPTSKKKLYELFLRSNEGNKLKQKLIDKNPDYMDNQSGLMKEFRKLSKKKVDEMAKIATQQTEKDLDWASESLKRDEANKRVAAKIVGEKFLVDTVLNRYLKYSKSVVPGRKDKITALDIAYLVNMPKKQARRILSTELIKKDIVDPATGRKKTIMVEDVLTPAAINASLKELKIYSDKIKRVMILKSEPKNALYNKTAEEVMKTELQKAEEKYEQDLMNGVVNHYKNIIKEQKPDLDDKDALIESERLLYKQGYRKLSDFERLSRNQNLELTKLKNEYKDEIIKDFNKTKNKLQKDIESRYDAIRTDNINRKISWDPNDLTPYQVGDVMDEEKAVLDKFKPYTKRKETLATKKAISKIEEDVVENLLSGEPMKQLKLKDLV